MFKHFKRDNNQWLFYVLMISFFMAIPLFSILINLFDGVGEMWDHIFSYFLFDYISNSIFLLLGTGLLTFLLGTTTAWIVTKYDFRGRKIVEWLLFLPLAIPSYIVAYSYVGLLGNGGSLARCMGYLGFSFQKIEMMNIYGLIWVLSLSLFPYVYAGTRAMFNSYPNVIRDTAYLLKASEAQYFYKVALPLASPAIIGGLFLVFMEVLNDYGAAKYYGVNTFTTGIFRTWTALEDLQSAIYLSGILVLLVFVIVGLTKWQRGKKSYAIRMSEVDENQRNRVLLIGKKKFAYYTILSIPILFGFVLPVVQLLYWAVLSFESMFNIELFWITIQSFSLAVISAFLIVLVALLLVYFARWNHLKSFNFFTKTATIGYVVPGAIIGIGIIRSSQFMIDFFSDNFNLKIGYLFYSSSIILVYAYVFRFLAVAFNPIEANSLKLGKYLSESSYLLGISKMKTFIKIDFPLLRNTLITAFLVAFIDILKELPLTLILKPYDLDTLALTAFAYADDEQVAKSALPALVLIFVIGLLMLVLNYRSSKSK